MNRNLIKQIRNEWRENMWLCIELLIVSVAVWALSLDLFSTLSLKFKEKGYDITNVYKMNLRYVDQSSPEFVALKNEDYANDIRALLARLRRSPYVELVGLSNNSIPYNYNYSGTQLRLKGFPDSIRFQGNLRTGSPEMVRILRLKSPEGYTAEQLEKILRKNEILISDGPGNNISGDEKLKITDSKSLVGHYGHFGYEEGTRRIGGLIAPMKRSDYEPPGNVIYVPIDEKNDDHIFGAHEIAVLVKPDMGKKFEDEFYSSPDMRRLRNVYLTELVDMKNVRALCQRSQDSEMRLWVAGVIFLLLIIFLGLLGTFWFRIRQRTGEIALRKTCGATSSNVFRRIVSEGLLLLLFISIPALIADGLLTHYLMREYSLSMTDYQFSWIPAGIAYLIAMTLMVIMIIIGVWFPARQAMKIEPAIALKDE